MMEFDILRLLASIGGGMFGAAVGGVPAFVLCGFVALGTFGYGVLTGAISAQAAPPLSSLGPFGPWVAPHIAFGGGVGAAAYAARKGKLDSGLNCGTPLAGLGAPDVLFVGGIFGALGYLVEWFLANYSPIVSGTPVFQPVVTAIIVSNIAARLVFGKAGLFGKPKGQGRWIATETAAWLPWQEKPDQLLAIGFSLALPTAYVVSKIPSVGFDLPLAISASWLFLLVLGLKMPVGHHITLSAATATLLLGNFWWGVGFGVLAAFLGEFAAGLFVYHGDTLIDPPTSAILMVWVTCVLIAPLVKSSVAGAAVVIAAIALIALGYFFLVALKQKPKMVQAQPS